MRISILHGYSDSNKGDLAIVWASVKSIQRLRPDSSIVLHSVYALRDKGFDFHNRHVRSLGIEVCSLAVPSPYVDEEGHSALRNLRALRNLACDMARQSVFENLPHVARLLKISLPSSEEIKRADLVLLKGGQYIYNDQGGLRGFLYLIRLLSPVKYAGRLRKRIIVLGQSIGPLQGVLACRRVANSLSNCESIMVRERLSAELLSALGLGRITKVVPDLAFLIRPCSLDSISGIQKVLGIRRWIGVTVVNWSYPDSHNIPEDRRRYEEALFIACRNVATKHSMSVMLFPQVTVRHHGESDLEPLQRLADKLRKTGIETHLWEEDLNPEQLSALYGQCELLIGTRLHSCILAACAGCPIVAIRYQGFKTQGVMQQLGLEHMVHDIATVTASDLARSVDQLLAKREEYSAAISRKVLEFRKQLDEELQGVLRVCEV